VQHFVSLARELEMAIGLTYLEAWEPAPRNTFSLIDRNGETRLSYAKVHTCDFDQEAALTPGDGFRVARLDTAAGPVEIGAMICFDREFPESARMLMLLGAEVVLVPNACPMDDIRRTLLKARAFENMFVVALANYTDDPDANGGSAAFHPMAWEGPDGPPRDTTIVRAGTEEGVVFADVDLEALRAWRASETQGNAYRKPRAYGALTADDVRDPFYRPDARR
jgi:predicted amidohydrolase